MLNLHKALALDFQQFSSENQIRLHRLFRYIQFVIQSQGPDMIPGKQRKRKTYFISIFLLIAAITENSAVSRCMQLCLLLTLHSALHLLQLCGQSHTLKQTDWK